MSTAANAQASRDRARERRLKAAGERRRQLDPDELAREQRIDEATVDVEVAWDARTEAERAKDAAEHAAAVAVQRLVSERLSVTAVAKLTGLDLSTVCRLRHVVPRACNLATDRWSG